MGCYVTGTPVEVHSTFVKRVLYKDGDLTVTLVNGGTYRYRNVPQDIYEGLLEAPSKGKYFGEHIKRAYAAEKVV